MPRVLLVEDEQFVSKVLAFYLEGKGYRTTCVSTAGEAMGQAREPFDVILLDILLPDADGIDLCRQLRRWHSCPIIFLTCLDDSETTIRALDAGGDDFLTKPFDNDVLLARIEANLRRVHNEFASPVSNALVYGPIELDVERRVLTKATVETHLPPMECRLLAFLMEHEGQYFASEDLYRYVWGKDSYGDVRTVLVHIRHLRLKIEDDPNNPAYLKNIWGRGYAFDPKG